MLQDHIKEIKKLAKEAKINLKIIKSTEEAIGYACSDYFPEKNLCVIKIFESNGIDEHEKRILLLHEFGHCINGKNFAKIKEKEKIDWINKNARYFHSWIIANEALNLFFRIIDELMADRYTEKITGKTCAIDSEETKRDIIKTYGKLNTSQRKKLFKSNFPEMNFNIDSFRSTIGHYHQIVAAFLKHKEVRKDDYYKILISAFPRKFFITMKNICEIVESNKSWKEKINLARPYLKEEIYQICKLVLRKKRVDVKDVENMIKNFYANVKDGDEKKMIMEMNISDFEKLMKNV